MEISNQKNQSSSKSFGNVNTAVEEFLTQAKLSFFSYFVSLLVPILVKYQMQNPMLPYLYTGIVNLFRYVLKLISKDEVSEKCLSDNQFSKRGFKSGNICKKNRYVTLRFSIEHVLFYLKRKYLVKDSDIKTFMMM